MSLRLHYVRGNAVSLAMAAKPFPVAFAHGCNCFCSMGGGIAAEVRQRLPALAIIDAATKRGDRQKLGTFTSARFHWGIGYNLYTQYTYHNPNDMVDWKGVENSLGRMFLDMQEEDLYVAVIPKICSGLARGRMSEKKAWGKVVKLLEKVCPSSMEVVVVEFDYKASDGTQRLERLWETCVPPHVGSISNASNKNE